MLTYLCHYDINNHSRVKGILLETPRYTGLTPRLNKLDNRPEWNSRQWKCSKICQIDIYRSIFDQ